jgi:hypothetical protein
LENEFDSVALTEANRSRRRGKEEDGLTRGVTTLATETVKEGAASRELGQRLDSAQGGEWRARGSNRPRGRVGLLGRKQGREVQSFSFSFSIISKHFQMILNPNLNLN